MSLDDVKWSLSKPEFSVSNSATIFFPMTRVTFARMINKKRNDYLQFFAFVFRVGICVATVTNCYEGNIYVWYTVEFDTTSSSILIHDLRYSNNIILSVCHPM